MQNIKTEPIRKFAAKKVKLYAILRPRNEPRGSHGSLCTIEPGNRNMRIRRCSNSPIKNFFKSCPVFRIILVYMYEGDKKRYPEVIIYE